MKILSVWFVVFALLSPLAGVAANRIALVFDDGPEPKQSARLLELLRTEGAKVTFSYVGKNVQAHPEFPKAAAAAGHDVCNHSYTHPHLLTLKDEEVKQELAATSAAIKQAIGREPSFFWAPFLEHDARVDRLAKEAAGLDHFPLARFHFVSSEDWNVAKTDAAGIYHNATTGVTDLTVILFHEWRGETVDQLPAILKELRRQGGEFLTFSEIARLAPAAAIAK